MDSTRDPFNKLTLREKKKREKKSAGSVSPDPGEAKSDSFLFEENLLRSRPPGAKHQSAAARR